MTCFRNQPTSPLSPSWGLGLVLYRKDTVYRNPPADFKMYTNAQVCSGQPNVPSAVYAPSKSILNWYGVRINAEDEWLNTFVFDPGWCQTEMGNAAAHNWGMESAPGNPEESTRGMVDVIINGTKEQYGGKFVLSTGEVREW